jgi:hypothetical protein
MSSLIQIGPADSAKDSPTKASSSARRSVRSAQRQEMTGYARSKPRQNVDKGKGRESLAAGYEPSSSEGEAETSKLSYSALERSLDSSAV